MAKNNTQKSAKKAAPAKPALPPKTAAKRPSKAPPPPPKAAAKPAKAGKSKSADEDESLEATENTGAPKAAKGKPAPKKPAQAAKREGDESEGDEEEEDEPAAKPAAKKPAEAPKVALSPRATARTPERAEELKAKLGALSASVNQIKALKRSLNKSFFDIGELLRDIESNRLFEVKGYGSFEAFLEREIDLGKQVSLKLVRIVQTFVREAALSAGYDRTQGALAAFEGDEDAQPEKTPSGSTPLPQTRSRIPLHKQ